MDDNDMYGSKVYSYNFEGRSNISSTIGVLVSIIVNIFMIKFLVEQVIVMVEGTGPKVSSMSNLNVHTEEGEHVELDKDGLFFAVGIRNYNNNEYKDSYTTTREALKLKKLIDQKKIIKPDEIKTAQEKIKAALRPYSYGDDFIDPTGPNPWVKWVAQVYDGDGATSSVLQTVGLHPCSDYEWAVNFEAPARKDKVKI
jgi:hypothetical protein